MIVRRQIWIDLLLYPGHTLPTAIAPALIAAGLALHNGVFAPLPLALAFLGSWFIHVGGVLADNHELLRRYPTVPEHPELLAALRDGSLKLSQLRLAIAGCFLFGVLPGVYLAPIGGLPVIALGIIGLVAAWAYAAGPAYARHGLADPIFLLMFGVVAVAGCYYIQAASHAAHPPSLFGWVENALPWQALIAGLPVGALVTNVLIIDDIRDSDFDRLKGWQTTAVRFGRKTSEQCFAALWIAALIMPAVFYSLPGFQIWVFLTWLLAPAAIKIARDLAKGTTLEELRPLTPRMAALAMCYALLLGTGLAIEGISAG
jgi:1,4-dihydroxy-2-naphthoate octaprenyltransferase